MDKNDVARAVRQTLESLERAGITHLRRSSVIGADRLSRFGGLDRMVDGTVTADVVSSPTSAKPSVGSMSAEDNSISQSASAVSGTPLTHASRPAAPVSLFAATEGESFGANLRPDQKLSALGVLQTEVAGCTRCKELADTRTQTVFGVGNPNARLVFIGEAPGADEDAQGEPFVGRAGQLLTDIITKGMKLRREDVYILNVLKCRPPNNRNPAPNEVINCRGFLDRQLEIIQPEFICCLGSIAAKTLLNTDLSIGRLRKKFYDYHGIPVLCTYHPAYLLRNPAAKREVWEDIQLLMQRMGLPVAENA